MAVVGGFAGVLGAVPGNPLGALAAGEQLDVDLVSEPVGDGQLSDELFGQVTVGADEGVEVDGPSVLDLGGFAVLDVADRSSQCCDEP